MNIEDQLDNVEIFVIAGETKTNPDSHLTLQLRFLELFEFGHHRGTFFWGPRLLSSFDFRIHSERYMLRRALSFFGRNQQEPKDRTPPVGCQQQTDLMDKKSQLAHLTPINSIPVADLYKEACSMLRHYSTASLHIRIGLIAQGIIVLSGSGYLFREKELELSVLAAGFGLLLTLVLYFLHRNYQRQCDVFTTLACGLESDIKNEQHRVVSVYESLYQDKVNTPIGDLLIINGFFYFMLTAFIIEIIAAVYLLLS